MNDKVMGRLAKGRKTEGQVSPMDAVSRALFFAGTGQILPSSQPKASSELDEQLKRQKLLTGTPEFKMQQAQATASADLANKLKAEEMMIEAKRQRQMGMSGQAPQAAPSGGQTFGFSKPGQATPALLNGQAPLGQMGNKSPKILYSVPKVDPDTGVAIPDYQLGDNPDYISATKQMELDEAEKKKKLSEEEARQSGMSILQALQNAEKGLEFFGGYGDMPTTTPFGTPNPLVTTNYQGKRGERADWEANFGNLESQKMIDTIMKMKEASPTGATGFGQLSEKEGQVLRNASMKLRRNLDQKDAQRYIVQMKEIQKKALGMDYDQAIIDQAVIQELGNSPASPSLNSPSTKTSFNSPEEADASGLPPGTIVNVGGRRYQI